MRILHVTNAYPFAEIPEFGVFVKEQIAALNRAGVQADVLFVNARGEGKKAYLKGIQRVREAAPEYDAIHCHHLYSAIVVALARARKPVVLSFQNDWLHEVEIKFKPLQFAMCKFGVWFADRVIFKSPIPKQFRDQGKKFVHLPNGVNASEFNITSKKESRARLGLNPNAKYIMFVSSKDQNRPQKRYDRFAETIRLLQGRHSNIDIRELVMVNQKREKVTDFFNSADLHLLCSDFEGSPNSVKEALCTGLPVVCTNVGNVEEMLSGVPFCFVASDYSANTLADLISQCLTLSCDRVAVRTAFLKKDLSQEAATKKLSHLYAELIGIEDLCVR